MTLPFIRPGRTPTSPSPQLFRIDDLEEAFSSRQTRGRLVLTQPSYLLQAWLDIVGPDDRFIMTADLDGLQAVAPEVLRRAGPWRAVTVERLTGSTGNESSDVAQSPAAPSIEGLLAEALQRDAAEERLRGCRLAAEQSQWSAVAALALASASRDVGDLAGARLALDQVLTQAGDWAAAHFEDGKLWLSVDDMPRARDAFQRAVDVMPAFTGALSNLGAVCGELGETTAAAQHFARVLDHDPENVGALNNVGVVNRELGRLEVSEGALLRVTTLAPEFVFGHYNLGHTRFLRGDFPGALDAYEEGRRRDPEKNRRQSGRLAMVRFAMGDFEGAASNLWQALLNAPPAEQDDMLLEAREAARALVGSTIPLEGQRTFVEQLEAKLATRRLA